MNLTSAGCCRQIYTRNVPDGVCRRLSTTYPDHRGRAFFDAFGLEEWQYRLLNKQHLSMFVRALSARAGLTAASALRRPCAASIMSPLRAKILVPEEGARSAVCLHSLANVCYLCHDLTVIHSHRSHPPPRFGDHGRTTSPKMSFLPAYTACGLLNSIDPRN